MIDDDDPLWDPAAQADEDLARIQNLLGRYGVRARDLSAPRMAAPSRLRRSLPWALAASIALLLMGAGFQYRLSWTADGSWSAVLGKGSPSAANIMLAPGQRLGTATNQTAMIEVARIGEIRLSPDSRLRLLETRSGHHRVKLEHGHMRARIWAPPGYFAVSTEHAEVVDLGCDFDIWTNADGSGRVSVRSGWVSYRVGSEDILVPQGYTLGFAADRVQTPLADGATPEFAQAVETLESAVRADPYAPTINASAQAVAVAARDEDAFTLLSLLTRWPRLATTDLYSRLGKTLGIEDDDAQHRRAWVSGDAQAIDAWWQKLPRHPKQWWVNWRDALG
mgnify:FL=1|jgi:hypothetical protein